MPPLRLLYKFFCFLHKICEEIVVAKFTKYSARPARELEQVAATLAFNASQQKTSHCQGLAGAAAERTYASACTWCSERRCLVAAGGRHPEGRYGGTKVFPKAGDHFQLSDCMWKQSRGRKQRHEAEKCISLLGAGGRHPEGRYGGTKVFPKAGDHFSNKRLHVQAQEGKKEEA